MKEPIHLKQEDLVNNGSYYTSQDIVEITSKMIEKYVDETTVIVDTSAGCGSFASLKNNFENKFIFADIDSFACDFMNNKLKLNNVVNTNSLLNVSRDLFGISLQDKLVIVGNPPYNDWTSQSKKNLKKNFNLIMDEDLFARDLGVSFLKSYSKLKADIVCVLHPLSYLIKETNFRSLKEFKDNYILKDSCIISSGEFANTGSTKFPIVIALYIRNNKGMTYDYIREFNFNVKDKSTFRIDDYRTSDKWIRKYPPIIKDRGKSPLNLYFFPYRDINSLKRSKTFIVSEDDVSNKYIVVTLSNFHKYAYLEIFKKFFNGSYVYGNLSPLLLNDIESNEKLLEKMVTYTIKTNQEIRSKLSKDIINQIIKYYKIDINKYDSHKYENEFTEIMERITGETDEIHS